MHGGDRVIFTVMACATHATTLPGQDMCARFHQQAEEDEEEDEDEDEDEEEVSVRGTARGTAALGAAADFAAEITAACYTCSTYNINSSCTSSRGGCGVGGGDGSSKRRPEGKACADCGRPWLNHDAVSSVADGEWRRHWGRLNILGRDL